ncbi:hypothetical protein V8G54_011774 [Vigna mungo]|uniref:Uncharacterized protein n=1 Tax=Vigna mungo TaxID=3915 RepID=A0AAQ3S2N3_VIGMU
MCNCLFLFIHYIGARANKYIAGWGVELWSTPLCYIEFELLVEELLMSDSIMKVVGMNFNFIEILFIGTCSHLVPVYVGSFTCVVELVNKMSISYIDCTNFLFFQ